MLRHRVEAGISSMHDAPTRKIFFSCWSYSNTVVTSRVDLRRSKALLNDSLTTIDKFEKSNWNIKRTNLFEKTGFFLVFYVHSPLGRSRGRHHFLRCNFGDILSKIFRRYMTHTSIARHFTAWRNSENESGKHTHKNLKWRNIMICRKWLWNF